MTKSHPIAENDVPDFLAAIDATIKIFNVGDIVTGTVVFIDHTEVMVDLGGKTEGIIPLNELAVSKNIDPHDIVLIGDPITCMVIEKDAEGNLVLSLKRASVINAWTVIEGIYQNGDTVIGTVIETTAGGLIVDLGLRAFLPASLVELKRVADLTPYIGMEIQAYIIELDKSKGNVVISRKAYLIEKQKYDKETFWNQLEVGQVYTGIATSIMKYGVFIDLSGGVDALLHSSQMIPNSNIAVGDSIPVEIIEIDIPRQRISLKQLEL